MKGFSGYARTTVELRRGDEAVSFTLRPLPVGYGDLLSEYMPPPKPPPGAKEPEQLAHERWLRRRGMLLLAYCVGEVLDTRPPPGPPVASSWERYADAVLEEFRAAHLVEGDLQRLLDAMGQLNRGLGDLPKA